MKRIFAILLFVCAAHGHAALLDFSQIPHPGQLTQEGMEALERKATQGDAVAQVTLGFRYLEPVVNALNLESLETAQQSMQTVNAAGVYADALRKGLYWTQKSAVAGLPVAQRLAGFCYLVGLGTKANPDVGWGWLKKAADNGDAEARYLLGLAYFTGEGLPVNIELGIMYMVTAAGQGHVEAKRFLDAPILSLEAQRHSTRSEAEAGNAQAQYDLADSYAYGSGGVEHDDAIALQWYQRAAEQGHPEAALRVAIHYARGLGTTPDDAQAMRWFQIAAQKNSRRVAEGMTDMGRAYLAGEGVPRSRDVARQWFMRAAALNSVPAQRELAWMYAHGDGVPQSYEQATQWYAKSAALGDASSQYQLAAQYIKGQGVEANPETAYFWWLLSTKQKYIGGELNSEGYWDALTTEQKERQRKLADQWAPGVTGN